MTVGKNLPSRIEHHATLAPAINGAVAMKDLLQDLRVCGSFDFPLRDALQLERMRGSGTASRFIRRGFATGNLRDASRPTAANLSSFGEEPVLPFAGGPDQITKAGASLRGKAR